MHALNRPSTRTLVTLLLSGAAVAMLVLALGKGNAYRLHAKLEQLELVCIAVALDEGQHAADAKIPLCDPTTLTWTESAGNPYSGIQAEIVATQAAIWRLDALLVPFVCAIAVLSAVPWTMRFLRVQARRLRKEEHDGMTTPGG